MAEDTSVPPDWREELRMAAHELDCAARNPHNDVFDVVDACKERLTKIRYRETNYRTQVRKGADDGQPTSF